LKLSQSITPVNEITPDDISKLTTNEDTNDSTRFKSKLRGGGRNVNKVNSKIDGQSDNTHDEITNPIKTKTNNKP
jgi:hypothetical protein